MKATFPALLITLIAVGNSHAQSVPDALQRNPAANPDRINEEQRRRLEERAQGEAAPVTTPQVEAPPPAAASSGADAVVTFRLMAVRFPQSGYLSQAELDATVADQIGRDVSLADLRMIVDRVNAFYTSRGLTTARAVLPPQDVQNGVVDIQLVEGRIGATSVEQASRRSEAYVAKRGSLPAGALASPTAVADQLRLFNQNNDAQLRARLAPGERFGATDLVLVAAEPPRIGLDVFTDNYGFASTGRQEVGAVVRAYRLFGPADRLTGVFVASRGVRSGNAALSTPISDRFRLGTSFSYGRTHILFGNLAALEVRGTSMSFGADAAALLLVDDRSTVTATASVQTSLSKTRVAGNAVIENNLLTPTLGIAASYVVTGLAVTVAHQVAVPIVRERVSGDGTAPVLFQGSAAVTAGSSSGIQVRARANWQVATKDRLPGILQFQIGGPRSSRAFEPGISAGDRGLDAAIEIGRTIATQDMRLDPFVFVDHAQAFQPGLATSVQSLGAGLSAVFAPRVQARASVAHSIGGHNVGRATARAYASVTLRL